MKNYYLIFFFGIFHLFGFSQELHPIKIDEQCFKTMADDYFVSAIELENKNYILSGYFGHINFMPNQPDTFCHLVLVDSNFRFIKAVKSPMFVSKIFENYDGSLTLVGTIIKLFDSKNVFDDINGNSLYQPDIALMKIDSSLENILLTKAIGGTGEDTYLSGIVKTKDNGILFSAATRSMNGDIPGNRACLNTMAPDAFLCKTDSNFNIEWIKVFEGENGELAMGELIEIKDEVYRLDIRSSSNQCEFANTKPFTYVFKSLIVLFDSKGNVLKKKIYDDETDLEWKTGGWHKNDTTVILGYADSKNAYLPTYPNKDKYDFAIALYDTNFNIIGMKLWGGLGFDILMDYLVHDDFIYVFGKTNSSDSLSDINGYHGGTCDYYIAKLDMDFNIIWNRAVGSAGKDCELGGLPFPKKKMFINDSNILTIIGEIYGPKEVPDGDVTCSIDENPNGSFKIQDAWIVRFDLNTILSNNNQSNEFKNKIRVYPNPSTNNIIIEISDFNLKYSTIKIHNMNGSLIYQKYIDSNQNKLIIDLNELNVFNQTILISITKDNSIILSEKMMVN